MHLGSFEGQRHSRSRGYRDASDTHARQVLGLITVAVFIFVAGIILGAI